MKFNIIKLLFSFFLLASLLFACEKQVGDYSAYLDKAEGVYPGKPISLTVLQGLNRADLSMIMSPDPRVVKIRIYWNNRRDSVEANVTASEIAKQKIIKIPSIGEGVYTFEAVTFDAKERKSITLQKTASILTR